MINSFGKKNSCSQWEGPSMHSRCLAFFLFKFFWGAGKDREGLFFIFLGSQCVNIMFPSISQSVFIKDSPTLDTV